MFAVRLNNVKLSKNSLLAAKPQELQLVQHDHKCTSLLWDIESMMDKLWIVLTAILYICPTCEAQGKLFAT